MILEHVAQKSGVFKIFRPMLDPDGLRHRDLDGINIVAVPDRLENKVRKAEHQNVLNGLLAEIMVDPVDLAFTQTVPQGAVKLLRALQVAPERFFDHHVAPRHIADRILGKQT